MQLADISVVEELEVRDEEEDGGKQDMSPQPQPQLTPLTPSLYLASLSNIERRQVAIRLCNGSDVTRNPSDQPKSCCGKG